MTMPLINTTGIRDFREIAAVLGLSVKQTRDAYYNGLEKLRKIDMLPALQLAAQLEAQRQDNFQRDNVIREIKDEVSEWAYL